jgi:hypothetical protein
MDAKEERRKRDRERYARMTTEVKQDKLKKRREAYQQKKTKEPEQRTKRCAQDRQRYANMQSEKKKARIEQVTANRELKRSTPCKESIAMVNPAYIATEQEVGTSTLNMRQRKPVTPGERQTLLHRRNEEFSVKKRKIVSISSQEDTSVVNSGKDIIEPLKQPQVLIDGNT